MNRQIERKENYLFFNHMISQRIEMYGSEFSVQPSIPQAEVALLEFCNLLGHASVCASSHSQILPRTSSLPSGVGLALKLGFAINPGRSI